MSPVRSADLPRDDVSPIADPSSRLEAALLDGAVATLPGLVLMSLGAAVRSPAVIHAGVWLAVVSIAVFLTIDLVLLARYGQTVGMRLAGLRIVRADGTRATLARILVLRSVLPRAIGLVPVLGWLFTIVDALCVFSSDRRTIHDHMADTIVVDLRAPIDAPPRARAADVA